jgi:hypothetical protein
MKMNLNGLSSGFARLVELCKPPTEECEQLLLLLHQTGAGAAGLRCANGVYLNRFQWRGVRTEKSGKMTISQD